MSNTESPPPIPPSNSPPIISPPSPPSSAPLAPPLPSDPPPEPPATSPPSDPPPEPPTRPPPSTSPAPPLPSDPPPEPPARPPPSTSPAPPPPSYPPSEPAAAPPPLDSPVAPPPTDPFTVPTPPSKYAPPSPQVSVPSPLPKIPSPPSPPWPYILPPPSPPLPYINRQPPPPLCSGLFDKAPPIHSAESSPSWNLIIIGGIVTAVFLMFIIPLCFYVLFAKRNRRDIYSNPQPISEPVSPPHPLQELSQPSASFTNTSNGDSEKQYAPSKVLSFGVPAICFTYKELKEAANNFAEANLLGKGGFGNVYKGIIASGKVVAIKQMKLRGGHGKRNFREEIEIISRVHHRHLVTLVGYCIMKDQQLLVYDYVPNRTLEYHLHGKGTPVMSWKIRQSIALGTAKGLAYLHEDCRPRIIHQDIKSANILIDKNFEALVSDFGLAKFTPNANTNMNRRVMGTIGYLAPEYASCKEPTDKSDIFSFGVVLLELVTGRRPVNPYEYENSLVEWARPLLTQVLEQRNFDIIVDPNLNNNYDEDEMMRVVEAAMACIQYSANERPKMDLVVRALEEAEVLAEMKKKVLSRNSSLYSGESSVSYNSSQYETDMTRFEQVALGSQQYGSITEYSEWPVSTEFCPR